MAARCLQQFRGGAYVKAAQQIRSFQQFKTVSKRSIRSIRAIVLPLILFLRNWLFAEMLENMRFWGKLFCRTSYNRIVQSVQANAARKRPLERFRWMCRRCGDKLSG